MSISRRIPSFMLGRRWRKSLRKGNEISGFPFAGRMVPDMEEDSIREVVEGNYRIIYRILEDRIDILTVLHGRMNVRKRLGRVARPRKKRKES